MHILWKACEFPVADRDARWTLTSAVTGTGHAVRPSHVEPQVQQDRTAVASSTGPRVRVVRSRGRVRSSSARVQDGEVVLRLPAHLSMAAARRTCGELLGRLEERATAPVAPCDLPRRGPVRSTRGPRGPRGDQDLVRRADTAAARWLADHDVRPASVQWSHRMTTRWASVTLPDRRVRLSHRLADAPDVVLDVLLVHELAHVVHSGHGAAFRALADRHPQRAEVDRWLARRTQDELRAALGLD